MMKQQLATEMETPWDACVLLLGCDRSGTTLLQNLLNAHPEIMITYEQGLIYPFESVYREQGAEAVVQLARARGLLKGIGTFNEDSIRQCWGDQSFAHLMTELFRRQALRQGKRIWGDKRPDYTAQVLRLDQLFPNAFFVHIVRDPRAVAFSWAQTDWGPMTVYHAAEAWKKRVREARLALELLEPHRSISVRFEELVEEPNAVLMRICAAIGVRFEPRMLEPVSRGKSRLNDRLERLHPLRNQPIQKQIKDKWLENPKVIISHIETLCHEEMSRWGYKPVTLFKPQIPLLWKVFYRVLSRGRRSWHYKIRPLLFPVRC
ncbi:sulfotransferase family protein [Desulfobacterota bacterium M19]